MIRRLPSGKNLSSDLAQTEVTSDHTEVRSKVTPDQTIPDGIDL